MITEQIESTPEPTELTTEQAELIEKLNCLEFETSQLNRAYQLWRSYVEQGTAPDWMATAIRVTYDGLIAFCLDISTILADVPDALSARHLALLGAAPCEVSGEESTTAEPSPELLPMPEISEQPNIQQGREEEEEADVPDAFSARHLAQLQAAPCEISGVWGEENTTAYPNQRNNGAARRLRAEPSPELLPMPEPDLSGPEMPVAISSPSTGEIISKQPVIQPGQQEEETGAEPSTIRSLATLADWLQRSSTGILFFIPPGALGRLFRATSVAVLIVAVGAMGIYVASARRAAQPVQAAARAVAIPTSEQAGFKFDPDPVVAPLGSSFVLNAVLSRGSDVASVAAQIDYDANLLKFMGVSKGGFLVKDGRQVVLAQRDDPSTGVVSISAEESPGTPGISGDGPVFVLLFQAKKRGNATVSIVPGAHDSQGLRIEMAGSQVSVRVN
jgi:hypothetical protein